MQAKYKIINPKFIEEFNAKPAIIMPKLKVIPKKICGK
jgi:hypothetical protein